MPAADRNYIMINFNVPKHLKYHLDRLAKFKNVSRTSILNRLLEEWIRSELSQLENDGRIYELMSKLEGTIERSVLYVKSDGSTDKEAESKVTRSWEDSY